MTDEVLTPVALTLPDVSNVDNNVIPTGMIGISGACIFWYDGTTFQEISGSNTGD